MRGGTANCHVKISDTEIASPYVENLEYLLALNQSSLEKFLPRLIPGGTLIVNTSLVCGDYPLRNDVHTVSVAATQIASEHNNLRGANIVLLGAFCAASGLFEPACLRREIDRYFEKKGKSNPKNALCFDAGAAQARTV